MAGGPPPSSGDAETAPDELWCTAWMMAVLGSGGEARVAARAEGDRFSSEYADGTETHWG